MVVLWSFREDDVQLGSNEDLAQAEHNRRMAQAIRSLAKAVRSHQIMLHHMGITLKEVTRAMAKLNRLLRPNDK